MKKISDRAWMVSGLMWWTARLCGMPALASSIKYNFGRELSEEIKKAEEAGRLKRSKDRGKWVWAWSEQIDMRMRGERDPEARWAETWDGTWRLFSFDLPSKKVKTRRRLLRSLKTLGFGKLQDSLWVSPRRLDEVGDLMEAIDIPASELSFFEAKSLFGRDSMEIAACAWRWGQIGEGYDDYLKQIERMEENLPEKMDIEMAGNWIKQEAEHWLAAVEPDPLLPRPFDPEGNDGPDAWQQRQEFVRKILKRAKIS